MDYDDIDFQSQNFQLVVEDNNKFPQSLRSYALPKFDIDEHLEVHHTFDRLADTEVLLDIQHQENNWIEDFSPRNSTIEFSSSGAESCPFPRHNNVWSEATSSESVEMLLKSVGEDEMASQQAITKGTDALALNGSNNSQMMEPLPNDPSLLPPDNCHNSITISNEYVDKGQQQFEGLSQSTRDVMSQMQLDVSSLSKKFSSDKEDITEQDLIEEKLTSSSDGSNKEHLVVQPFEVFQSEIPLDSSLENSSVDDGSAANLPPKSSSFPCKATQGDPSSVSTGIASMGPGNLETQSFAVEECHEIDVSGKSEDVKSDNLQNAESQILSTDGKANDKCSETHPVNDDSCNLESFSCLEPSLSSSLLLNEESSSKSSDGLLQSIAYQAKVLNKDNEAGDKISIDAKDLPASELEKDGNIEKHTVASGKEDITKLSNMTEGSKDVSHVGSVHQEKIAKLSNVTEGSKDVGHVGPEHLEKDDSLHQSALATKNFNIDFGVERGTVNLDAVISERQELKGQFSNQMILETRWAKVNDDSNLGVDPVMCTLNKSEPDAMEKSPVGGEVKDNVDISKASLDSSEHDIHENSTLRFSAEEVKISAVALKERPIIESDNILKISSVAFGKSTAESDKESVVVESNEANIIHLETPANVDIIQVPSVHPCDLSSNEDLPLVTAKVDTSTAESTGRLTDSLSEQSILDKSVIDLPVVGVRSTMTSSTISHESHSEVILASNMVVDEKGLPASSLTASVCNKKDVEMSSLSVVSGNLDAQILNQPCREPDAVVNALSNQILDASADETSPATRQGTEQSEEANSTPAVTRQNLFTESERDAESHLLESGSGNGKSFQSNSGSPPIISCKDHSLDEVKDHKDSRGSPDHAGPTDRTNNTGEFTSHVSKESNESKDDQKLNLDVGSPKKLSHRNTTDGMHSPEQSQDSQGLHKELEEGTKHKVITKTPDENKNKQLSDRATRKVGNPKREARVKSQPKQGQGREKNPCSPSPKADKPIGSKAQMEILQQNTYTDSTTMRSSFPQTIQMSSLPDLNTSVSTAASFHQPFTDFQQVQLRAQIFVYGSLIQGVPPDEACMLAAFGEADRGRSLWEGAWRVAAERFQNNKSLLNIPETPVHSHAGALANEQGTKFTSQSKALNSPSSWSVSKAMISAPANPSPLWSVSFHDGLSSNVSRGMQLEFNSAASPMPSYQSSHIRHYVNNAIPWFSQSPRPASWAFSSLSPLDASSQHSSIQTVQLTPIRDSALPCTSSTQLVSPVTLPPNQGSTSVTTTSFVMTETPKKLPKPMNIKSPSGGQKSRKTKKISLPEELGTVCPVSQPQMEPASAVVISKHPSTSASFHLTFNSPINVASPSLVSATSHPISSSSYQIIGSGDTQQRIILSDDTGAQIEESKLQAEEAAGHAAAAVRHSQGVWSQLAIQRKSGLVSEVEEKLSSAAAAAAAATFVAKAAAEAAKVASEAALQAKMMADEALNSVTTGSTAQHSDVQKNLVRLNPASILKGKYKIDGSSSVISSAREAARMRVEAASAATKRAENLDAILKAAELAAEAVSQAGIIIAMGDPLPFSVSELVETGPDGYWKVNHTTDKKHTRMDDVYPEFDRGTYVVDDHDKSAKQFNDRPSINKERVSVTDVGETFPNNELSVLSGEKLGGGAGLKSASVSAQADRLEGDPLSNKVQGCGIRKESLVEILADARGLRGVWFSAWVLDVKDNKAYVCYTDLRSDEGPIQLKEWIPLEYDRDRVPRIRIAHPFTIAKYEATKKRRREVVGNYAWAVGDRVDAWIRDGWWEGIISEKSQEDETKLTVHFAAGGDSQVVRAWDLRPSLLWKDGQWIMWSHTNEGAVLGPNEGDTPHEKRQRLAMVEAANCSEVDGRGAGTLSRNMHIEDPMKLKESMTVNLLAKERTFSVGKNVKEDVNADALRGKRTGLQKEGSRVIFGVPRPGKKRKFMEVSKHYISDKTAKANEENDSVKIAKYLIPQASHLKRNTSKVDVKGKRATNSKPRGIRTSRSQSLNGTSTSEKDNTSITAADELNGGESSLRSLSDLRSSSFCNEDSTEGKKNSLETGSSANILGIVDNQAIESSKLPVLGVPLSRNRSSITDNVDKGNLFPAVDNPTNSENTGKAAADAAEPRRSNRRIQPTSRLLEGLQSSLIISKIPGVSHDKGAKTLYRSLSSSRGQSQS